MSAIFMSRPFNRVEQTKGGDVVEEAIKILRQERAFCLKNRDKCPHSDEYYEGYTESLSHSIAILYRAQKAGQTKE